MSEIQIAAYRVSSWLDTSKIADAVDELPVLHGIQARIVGLPGWRHMAEGGKALLFESADAAADWIRRNPVGPIQARLATAVRSAPAPLPGGAA